MGQSPERSPGIGARLATPRPAPGKLPGRARGPSRCPRAPRLTGVALLASGFVPPHKHRPRGLRPEAARCGAALGTRRKPVPSQGSGLGLSCCSGPMDGSRCPTSRRPLSGTLWESRAPALLRGARCLPHHTVLAGWDGAQGRHARCQNRVALPLQHPLRTGQARPRRPQAPAAAPRPLEGRSEAVPRCRGVLQVELPTYRTSSHLLHYPSPR